MINAKLTVSIFANLTHYFMIQHDSCTQEHLLSFLPPLPRHIFLNEIERYHICTSIFRINMFEPMIYI